MPSTAQAGDRSERFRADGTRDRLGEDPARWLDQDLMSHGDRREVVVTLIKSMDSIERVRAWRAVERALAAADDGESRIDIDDPRARIMQLLDQREEWLEMQGERPDRLEFGPRRPCDCCSDDGVTAADLRERDQDELERRSDGYSTDGVDTTETTQTTEETSLGQWGSDGEAAD